MAFLHAPSIAAEMEPIVTDMFIQCRKVLSLAADKPEVKQGLYIDTHMQSQLRTAASGSKQDLQLPYQPSNL